MNTYPSLDDLLTRAVEDTAPTICARVYWKGETIYSACRGWLHPDTRKRPVQSDTLFDLASVSKLFTTVTFMTLVEEGRLSLDQPVCAVLSQFSGLRPIRPYEDPLHWGDYVHPEEPEGVLVDASAV